MQKSELYNTIMQLPVFDTHTHLDSGWRQCTKGLYARNFFDICRYFWFKRELEAAGYPRLKGNDPIPKEKFPEEAEKLHAALVANRNTYWTKIVMDSMEDLYGIRPDSVDKILELSDEMEKKVGNKQWGYQVCDKIGVRKTVIGAVPPEAEADMELIKERTIEVPGFRIEMFISDIDLNNGDINTKIDDIKSNIEAKVKELHAVGIRNVRPEWPFKKDLYKAVQKDFSTEELRDKENLKQHLGHYLFGLFEEYGFSLQIFFGMQGREIKGLNDLEIVRTYAQNDTSYVASMHNIFEMYLGINFELFCASELSSLDMVQAARIYPNVYPGGMWWFNFRRSVYEKNMQYRVEALAASRSTFVASDARCIEWSYIKILMIKKIMAGFFVKQVKDGWLDEDAAIFTAKHWLHDTAVKIYSRNDK